MNILVFKDNNGVLSYLHFDCVEKFQLTFTKMCKYSGLNYCHEKKDFEKLKNEYEEFFGKMSNVFLKPGIYDYEGNIYQSLESEEGTFWQDDSYIEQDSGVVLLDSKIIANKDIFLN